VREATVMHLMGQSVLHPTLFASSRASTQRIKRDNVEGAVDHEVNEYIARGTVIVVNEGFQSVSYALFPTCPSLSEGPFFLF